MTLLVSLLVGLSVALLVLGVAELATDRSRAVAQQLGALHGARIQGARAATVGGATRRQRIAEALDRVGASLLRRRKNAPRLRQMLLRAGYRGSEAVSIFWGGRIVVTAGAAALALLLPAVAGASGPILLFAALWFAAFGWTAPTAFLRLRIRRRQREIERTLPDALDLLVVCVEAGLGLNQALQRVAEEIRYFSPTTAGELGQVNLEMRAGVPRSDALRSLGDRMGVEELRTLATMLIQADRFGTSIAQALRVHADTSRSRRRQRTEEAAAKTTIKLVFPLVFCIFPALFVVVLGPAMLNLIVALKGM